MVDSRRTTGTCRSTGQPWQDVSKRRYREAVKWYKKAAQQGNASTYNLGGCITTAALRRIWWTLAAQQGYARAQYALGLMYAAGLDVSQDYVMAHKWWTLAAAQGAEDARKARDEVAQLMTPDQITEAQRLAREWQARHSQP